MGWAKVVADYGLRGSLASESVGPLNRTGKKWASPVGGSTSSSLSLIARPSFVLPSRPRRHKGSIKQFKVNKAKQIVSAGPG